MIKSIQVHHFKAIERTNKIKIKQPLTAFIGFNGVGKSSLLEALEMFRAIVTEGLDTALNPWKGFEHVYYQGKKSARQFERNGLKQTYAPIQFNLDYTFNDQKINLTISIGQETGDKELVYFVEERIRIDGHERVRLADDNFIKINLKEGLNISPVHPDRSIISDQPEIRRYIDSWQFLSMNSFLMGNPSVKRRTGGFSLLHKNGDNIAEYLLAIRDKSIDAFDGILDTLRTVLPYAKDIQPRVSREIEKMVYLQMTEEDYKLPGWVFSTGTLKLLALLAVLRNPEPSPLIVIEEIENGLDPRTIHLVVEEIRQYVESGAGQVLVTTHSPYLLDLLSIQQIVFAERKDGKLVFSRPADSEEVLQWSKRFAPGQLYTQRGFSK